MHILGAPTLPLVKNPHEIHNLDLLIGTWFPPDSGSPSVDATDHRPDSPEVFTTEKIIHV